MSEFGFRPTLSEVRAQHARRTEADRQLREAEWSARKAKLREAILSPGVVNPERLTIAATGLRNLLDSFFKKQFHVRTIPDLERLAMDLICEAVRAGAFFGDEWLVWRTVFADAPHILNGVALLHSYAPPPHRLDKIPEGAKVSEEAVRIFAGTIETFAQAKLVASSGASESGDECYSSRWFTTNTMINSDQLRQAKRRKQIRAQRSKGQNLYNYADAIALWGEDAKKRDKP